MERKQNVIELGSSDLDRIMAVERRAFIPSIQTTEEIIRRRLDKNHIYLGCEYGNELVGTLALRFAKFMPDFLDFTQRNPTFREYAESDNEKEANAVFVYSIGVVPEHRNGTNAKRLLTGALNEAKNKCMKFLVGDARVPSYNGSSQNSQYEQFGKNEELHSVIDAYFKTRILPSRELIEQDPVAGFYLRVFPEGKVLGITDNKFWRGDEPCGGHMVIEYFELK